MHFESTPRRTMNRPFSVMLCTGCQASQVLSVLQHLREVVRHCPHGMLVRTTCLRGPLTCASHPTDAGVMVVLAPCSVDRVPTGPAIWLGPVVHADDVRLLCDYISRGAWEFERLPQRLYGHRPSPSRHARAN